MIRQNELRELVVAGIINSQQEEAILAYQKDKQQGSNPNRLLLIFGIMGTLLIGLGLILILAHNWDMLPRMVKCIISYIPLLASQIIAYYTLSKDKSLVWRECSGMAIFLGVGICISLISQIFNIQGDLRSFYLTWLILTVPIPYILKSNISLISWLILLTMFGIESIDLNIPSYYFYYLLGFVSALPYIYHQILSQSPTNSGRIIHWILPLSLLAVTMQHFSSPYHLFGFSMMIFLNIFYLCSYLPIFSNYQDKYRSYTVISVFGMIILLFVFSFENYWSNLFNLSYKQLFENTFTTSLTAILMISYLSLLGYLFKNNWIKKTPYAILALIFALIFFLIGKLEFVHLIINILTLCLGIYTIHSSLQSNYILKFNVGIFIIAILIGLRFFDSELNFILRGMIFIGLGVGFLFANFWIIKRRKAL